MRRIWILVFFLAGAANAADDAANACLTEAQRAQLYERSFERTLVGVFDIVPTRLELGRARKQVSDAQAAVKACSEMNCDAQRVALLEAQGRFESARAQSDARMENLKAKLAADVKAIRAEYPSCP